ncbi:MAG: YjgP/YjgQ family permease [Ignavibacteriae bacterium]|nr:MAG: YjgP/YjgQ family permease [Ignavibacteriota bacterium]
MRIKLIDRYIISQFIKNLLFALLCFIIIFILVDLFENLDKFIDNKVTMDIVFKYYFYFIPEIIKLITPIAVLLATLFTAGRMINFVELVAVKNAGISLMRFMMPFLAIGVVVTAITIYFNNWTVPEANKKKFFIERNYLGKNRMVQGLEKLYFQDAKNRLVIIEQFSEIELTANKVTILVFNPDTTTALIKRIDAAVMKWDNNNWVLMDAIERDFSSGGELLKTYSGKPVAEVEGIGKLNVVPEQIIKKQLKPDELNYNELSDFIDNQKAGGQSVDRVQVDFYSKISFPFSSIIVIIFGISISTGSKKRKGLALQFGISILVSFIYLGFVKISQSFGYNGDLNPMLTAWLANIAFAAFGGINLYMKNY